MANKNMLACLEMELEAEGLTYKKSSDFQGVLFTQIDPEYVELLHHKQLHPYSQYIFFDQGKIFWRVNVLSTEAYDHMIVPLLSSEFQSFNIHNGNIEVTIKEKRLITKDYEQLLDQFYSRDVIKKIELEIKTLTSFKQRGRYNVLPDLRLIYQSLMMKYNAVSGNEEMIDEDTLEHLVEHSLVSKYRLQTKMFPMEGKYVPGFLGTIGISFFGTDTMARYAKMLFSFGEFSGIGIKTGMGMGAIRIKEEDEK